MNNALTKTVSKRTAAPLLVNSARFAKYGAIMQCKGVLPVPLSLFWLLNLFSNIQAKPLGAH